MCCFGVCSRGARGKRHDLSGFCLVLFGFVRACLVFLLRCLGGDAEGGVWNHGGKWWGWV